MIKRLVYFDLAKINLASFFLSGFIQNMERHGYEFIVSPHTPEILEDPDTDNEWNTILFSIALFRVDTHDEEFFFCIDMRDSCKTGVDEGLGFHIPLLRKVKFYFKVNYNIEEINWNPVLQSYRDKIIPSPLFLPLRMPRFWMFFPRPYVTQDWNMRNVVKRINGIRHLMSLEEIRRLRTVKKETDIFFTAFYYNEKQHEARNELRLNVMEQIRKRRSPHCVTGFVSAEKRMPDRYEEFRLRRFSLKDYMTNLAKSRIGIYVRGLNDCLSIRLGQLLSLGLPIVGERLMNNKKIFYVHKVFSDQFAFDDPGKIVDQAFELLNGPEIMEEWREENTRIFESRFTPMAVTQDMLEPLSGDRSTV